MPMGTRFFKYPALLLLAVVGLSLPAAAQSDPALDQYFVANAAYNRKLYPVAIAQFEGFLAKHGAHAKADLARRGLGLSLYALKQYEKAMPQFAALLAKPNLDKAISRDRLIMLQGQCMLHSAKKDEAKQLFVEQLPKLTDASYKTAALAAICDVSFGKSDWPEVIAWTAKLLAAKPSPDQAARGLYQQGYALFRSDKAAEAAAALAKVEALEVGASWKTRASYLLGECHSSLGQYDKAEPAFAAALTGMTGSDGLECQYRLGVTRFILKKYEAAAADLDTYLKGAKPGADGKPAAHLGQAKLYLARSLLERDDFKSADRKFNELSTGDDLVAAKANLWWARVFSRNKDNFERSAQILEAAIARFNKSPLIDDLEFDYANAEMSRKAPEWEKAAAALGRVESRGKFGQLADAIAQRATCYHKLKKFADSLRSTDTFLAKFADHTLAGDVRFMRAENLFLLDRSDPATAAYGQYLAAHKDHPSALAAQLRIAQLHHLAGRWDQSLASAQPLLAKKPEGRLFAQLSFIIGDCQFRQDKWAEAIKPLEDFVAQWVKTDNRKHRQVSPEPNVDTALIQLAVAYDHTDMPDKALDHLLTLVSYYPTPTPHLPLALAEQGRLAFETKDLKLSRGALDRFLAEHKKAAEPFKKGAAAQLPRVMYYLGWVSSAEGKHGDAALNFSKVPRAHALGPDAALQHGIALVNAEAFEQAAKHFPEMLRFFKDPEKLPLVVYYAGLSAARMKDWGNAANYLKRLTETYPDCEFADKALYEWAWCERARDKKKEATALYDQLLAKHPSSPLAVKVQSELAELNLDSGAQEKVIAQLTETLKTVKDEALREQIRTQLASAHYKKGDHETAATMFESLIADYPKAKLMASMRFQAGESRLRLKETVTARDHFAAAAKIPGSDPALAESVLMRLGETQALTGAHKEAANTYRSFLGRYKESRWIRNAQFGLAYALENSDNSKAAVGEYSKLITDPKVVDLWTVRSRFQIGECYFNMQQYDKAIAEFVHVEINYKKYPSWQAKSVLEIGRVLLAQGKRDEAAQRFKDVINRYSKEKAAVVARQYLDEIRSN